MNVLFLPGEGIIDWPRLFTQLSAANYRGLLVAEILYYSGATDSGALGVAGVDVLHRQMEIPERAPLTAEHRAYLQTLKRHEFFGLTIDPATRAAFAHALFLAP